VTSVHLYLIASAALFCLSLGALTRRRHLVARILALNVCGASVFLLFVTVAYRDRADAPDPVPHAMVLTGIVVAVSATALALAVARRLARDLGRTELPDPHPDRESGA
jgi:multicomponent Na+:H+ antiporter subunit C